MSKVQNNATIVSTCNQRLTALAKYVKPKTETSINGEPMKLSELIGVYQACLDTRTAVTTTRAQLQKVLSGRSSAEATRQAIDKGLKAWIVTKFGADSQEALEFGFAPQKVTTKSVETKRNAVLQSQATREARGTMGKREKEKIKGTVVDPTAPADPATTAAAATPATVATNGVTASHS
jgi:hypothetical protein